MICFFQIVFKLFSEYDILVKVMRKRLMAYLEINKESERACGERHRRILETIIVNPVSIGIYENCPCFYKEVEIRRDDGSSLACTDLVVLGKSMYLIELKTRGPNSHRKKTYGSESVLRATYKFYRKNFNISPIMRFVLSSGSNLEYKDIERPLEDLVLDLR